MSVFRMPLSGGVMQSFAQWNRFLTGAGDQFGLINIELGQSSNPALEAKILEDVASYGKQLGRVEEGLIALLDHLNDKTLEDKDAIKDLRAMAHEIIRLKKAMPQPGT